MRGKQGNDHFVPFRYYILICWNSYLIYFLLLFFVKYRERVRKVYMFHHVVDQLRFHSAYHCFLFVFNWYQETGEISTRWVHFRKQKGNFNFINFLWLKNDGKVFLFMHFSPPDTLKNRSTITKKIAPEKPFFS